MKIVKLSARDVLRLTAVEIEPTGNIVTLGGKNGAGKSAVLDSIALALGGKKATPSVPIRQGAKRAEVVLDLGDLLVERVITQGADRLVVKGKDGKAVLSPQAALDKIVGAIAFDPLSFSRMSAREQAETLRRLVGLDTAKDDAEREKVFTERTAVNRDAANAKARLSCMTKHTDAPTQELSVAELTTELERRRTVNEGNENLRRIAREKTHRREEAARTMERLERELSGAKAAMLKLTEDSDLAAKAAGTVTDLDLDGVRAQIAGAEIGNRLCRENVAFNAAAAQVAQYEQSSLKLTDRLNKIDRAKVDKLAQCRFPLPGLGFGGDGDVTLNELPFSQASSAEKLRVSVAIACSANPELRVFFVRDGSLLDADGLRLIAEMAQERDAQVWVEDARTESAEAIIIEDGHVQEATP